MVIEEIAVSTRLSETEAISDRAKLPGAVFAARDIQGERKVRDKLRTLVELKETRARRKVFVSIACVNYRNILKVRFYDHKNERSVTINNKSQIYVITQSGKSPRSLEEI